jgi:hypothetical protein
LHGSKAALYLAFGLRAGRDQMGDPESGKGALELGAGIPVIRGINLTLVELPESLMHQNWHLKNEYVTGLTPQSTKAVSGQERRIGEVHCPNSSSSTAAELSLSWHQARSDPLRNHFWPYKSTLNICPAQSEQRQSNHSLSAKQY